MEAFVSEDKKPELVNVARIPHELDVRALRQMICVPGPDSWAACAALGYKQEEEAFEVLKSLATSADWRFRRTVVEAMATHRLGKSNGELICSFLKDSSAYVVRTACDAAAKLALSAAHDDVVALIRSTDAATRQCAIRALCTLWRPSDFAAVMAVFKNDTSEEVRREAGRTLRQHAEADNWMHLFEAWRKSQLHTHRIWACELAAEFGDKGVVAEVEAMTNDSDGHVRKAAKVALTNLTQ
jgi:hypothetical protein